MIPRTINTVVVVLACAHRRPSAQATVAHLIARGLWGEWQRRALLLGRCPSCEDDLERAT